MLEEDRVVRVFLAMIMRHRVRHGEIDGLQALAVFGLLHPALGRLDGSNDSLDMRIECQRGAGGETARKRDKQQKKSQGDVHDLQS